MPEKVMTPAQASALQKENEFKFYVRFLVDISPFRYKCVFCDYTSGYPSKIGDHYDYHHKI